MSKEDILPMHPDEDLASELRKGFTVRACVEALFKSVTEMCSAVGVEVSWQVVSIDEDKIVDRALLSKSLGRVATASGAMLAGGKVNPIKMLDAQDPIRIVREQRQKDVK